MHSAKAIQVPTGSFDCARSPMVLAENVLAQPAHSRL